MLNYANSLIELPMNHVLVMADMGERLERISLGRAGHVVHILHPERVADYESGKVGAVGFPLRCVFQFDRDLFARLRRRWEADGQMDDAFWQEAVPAYEP